MVAEVSITELRRSLARLMKRVGAGDELVITSRGRPVARLIPAVDARAAARERLQSLRARCRVGDVEAPIDARWASGR